MSVWAIADLHLSFARPDRRERYAGRWRDHAAQDRSASGARSSGRATWSCCRATSRWRGTTATSSPTWPGSTACPGTKVLAPGNHDAWWNGVASGPADAPPVAAGRRRRRGRDPRRGRLRHARRTGPCRRRRPRRRSPRPTASWRRSTGRSTQAATAPRRRRAALRPLALSAVRPAPPTRPLRRAARGGRRHGLRLRPPPHPGAVVAGRAGDIRASATIAWPPTPSASAPCAWTPGRDKRRVPATAPIAYLRSTRSPIPFFGLGDGACEPRLRADRGSHNFVIWEGCCSIPEGTDLLVNATSIGSFPDGRPHPVRRGDPPARHDRQRRDPEPTAHAARTRSQEGLRRCSAASGCSSIRGSSASASGRARPSSRGHAAVPGGRFAT